MITITNKDTGLRFNVRIVRIGDSYGLDDCLTNSENDPLVEFYDKRYPHTQWGQFVTRYRSSTLTDSEGLGYGIKDTGLILDGGIPDWWITAENSNQVLDHLRGI